MGEAIRLDCISERSDNVVLTKDIIEGAGSLFAGKNLVAHGECFRQEVRSEVSR